VAAALLAAVATAAPRPAAAQVVVMVNGLPVTALDVQQRMKLESLSQKHVSRDQALKLLIDDKLKITVAQRYGITLSDAEVNANFADIAKRMQQSPDQFEQTLLRSGVSSSALKNRIRADTVWQQLVRGKFGASLQIGEGEIASVLRSNEIDEIGYIYTLRPVVVVVPRGSSGAVVDAKRREAEAIRGRFQGCDQGLAMARRLRDVAVRNPVRRNSAELPGPFRELLSKLEVGRLTTPERTAQGFEMFALCDKKQTKTETAEKRQLKEKLFTERFEREASKFLEETRRSAIIEYR
jgi:peptidyl-prolyl cis-trans isomerase SurA